MAGRAPDGSLMDFWLGHPQRPHTQCQKQKQKQTADKGFHSDKMCLQSYRSLLQLYRVEVQKKIRGEQSILIFVSFFKEVCLFAIHAHIEMVQMVCLCNFD